MTDYNCSIFFWVRKKVRELFPFQHLPAYFQDLTQPGMWGMGNVYSGIEDILNMGVARCAVCAKDVQMRHINYFQD